MPPRDWKFRIQDILEAIDRINRYTQDMDYSGWQQDEKTVDAGMLKGSDLLSHNEPQFTTHHSQFTVYGSRATNNESRLTANDPRRQP